MIRATLILGLMTGPVLAQQATAPDALRPAPDYYVNAIIDITIAQTLARSCTTISLDPPKFEQLTDAVLAQLTDDGFDPDRPHEQMVDPGEQFAALQTAFMDKHALVEGIGEAEVCAASKAEIAEGTGIGNLLIEVPG